MKSGLVKGLKDRFTVVTIDLRGHGRSSKGIDGYRIDRLAQDIHEVIMNLDLHDMILMGWSMGGPTMLSYWKQFGKGEGRLAGLGLIDMTPFPFSSGAWNSHGLRDYNMEGFNAFVGAILKDRDGFATAFAGKIFKDGVIPPGMDWLHEEMMKLPPYLGIALYGDYCYSDYTDVAAFSRKAWSRGNGSLLRFPRESLFHFMKAGICCSGWKQTNLTRQ